jgi:hypothetical protein
MNRKSASLGVLLAAGLGIGLGAALTQAGAGPPVGGLFRVLKVGQSVKVKDLGTQYEISTYPRGHSGLLKVSEVGQTYLVIEDSRRNRTRIPVSSVKCILVAH